MSIQTLAFDQRACFIAGQAKSGTTLLASLLDGHPELLVLPQETAYFPTVLTKYGERGRPAQFDYLTRQSFSRVLFAGEPRWREHEYTGFPQQKFLETFRRVVFDPGNAGRDLLALMAESYAATFDISPDGITRWIEKTPANRNHIPAIFARFPHAKLLVTMRDPRAILAAQIALEKTRKTRSFSVYYVIAHWRVAAKLGMRVRDGEIAGLVIPYEQLVGDPSMSMQKVCDYLEIGFHPGTVLKPTKVGRFWSGNSAAGIDFSQISTEPVTRWEGQLSEDEIGWVEWHCRDLMPQFGYEPKLSRSALRYFLKPVRLERPKQYLKSRLYSLRDRFRR
jgi:hypothetical protein